MESKDENKRAVKSASAHKNALRFAMFATAGLLLIEPSIAAAAPWDAAVSAIAGTLQGTLGKAIAVIAVIVLGLMAMAGKLEWMTAIKVVIGIVIMFSASQIINWIAPNAGVSARVSSADVDVLPAENAGACNTLQGVWIQESPELKMADGTVVNHYHAAYCVDTKNGTAMTSATLACQSTTNVGAGTTVAPGGMTYYTTATAGATCS